MNAGTVNAYWSRNDALEQARLTQKLLNEHMQRMLSYSLIDMHTARVLLDWDVWDSAIMRATEALA